MKTGIKQHEIITQAANMVGAKRLFVWIQSVISPRRRSFASASTAIRRKSVRRHAARPARRKGIDQNCPVIATDLETALIFYRISGNVAVLQQSEQQQHPARE
jgi:hypothetical protein